MKKLMLLLTLAIVAFAQPTYAQSKCVQTTPGWFVLNSRVNTLAGKNFSANVSCSRIVVAFLAWRGGPMCVGKYLYGFTLNGKTFSCKIRSIVRR